MVKIRCSIECNYFTMLNKNINCFCLKLKSNSKAELKQLIIEIENDRKDFINWNKENKKWSKGYFKLLILDMFKLKIELIKKELKAKL